MQKINTFFRYFNLYCAAIILFSFISLKAMAQSDLDLPQSKASYNACEGCQFFGAKGLFFDDGGRENPVSNAPQTTTFIAKTGHKVVLFFENIDLPTGAKLLIYEGTKIDEQNLRETLTARKKMPNIIAEALTIQYIPAINTQQATGWQAMISEVLASREYLYIASQPESDCPNAINLCANNTVVALGGLYTDTGAINDDSGSCYSGTGSGGSVWYSFTPQTNGLVDFTITPTGSTDYDFVLWDITNGCQSGQRTEMACNFSSATGITGLNSTRCAENVGSCTTNDCTNQSKAADCNRFNNRVNVQTTRKYAICINFYGGSNDGFTLSFQQQASSVAITDNVPPTIVNAFTTNCASASNFHITFSEWLDCNTLQPSDFTMPGHTVAISNTNCTNGRTNNIDVTITPPLTTGTSFAIAGQNVLDLCGNNLNATYNINLSTPPVAAVSAPATVCKSPGFLGIGFNYSPSTQNLTATGGSFYTWNVGQTGNVLAVSPTANTTYTVTVVNNSCASTASVTVSVDQAAVSLGPDANYCGTPIVITANPSIAGANYRFYTNPNFLGNGTSVQNGPSNTLTVSPATSTTYRVVITTANGCTASDDMVISPATGTTATVLPATTTYCLNSNAINLSATPTGGTFSGPGVTGNTFSPTAAGVGVHTINYNVTNGCGTFTGTTTLTVANAAVPTLNLLPTYCVNAAAVNLTPSPNCGTLTGPGITNGVCVFGFPAIQFSFNPATAGLGTHTITYTGPAAGACAQTFTTTVVGAGSTPTISGVNNPYCLSSPSVTLTGTPAGGTFSGVGITGTNVFNPATAGAGTHIITYNVTSCGSTLTSSIPITVGSLTATATATQPSCAVPTGSILISPNNATTYAWTGGLSGANPTGVAAGTYTVTVTNASNCSSVTSVTLLAINAPNLAINAPNLLLDCNTTSLALTASSITTNISFDWGGGITTPINNVITANTYTVTATNTTNNCTATMSIVVTQDIVPPTPTITGQFRFCEGQSRLVTAAGGNTYTWSSNFVNPLTVVATVFEAGVYTVTATASNGCTASTTIDVVNVPLPVASTQQEITVNAGASVVLSGTSTGGPNLTYYWQPVSAFTNSNLQNQIITPTQDGIYTFYTKTPEGCESNHVIINLRLLKYGCLKSDEGFTPNADGVNDTWEIPCIVDVANTVSVYNRWGQLVFQATNYNGDWNGKENGRNLPDGTYYYIVTVPDTRFKGTVTIIR